MPDPSDPNRPDGDRRDEPENPGDPRNQADIDRRWRDIVEGLGPLGTEPEPGRPTAPGPVNDQESAPPADRELESYFETAPVWGPRDYAVDDDEDDEGDFVPPDPPALGTGRPALVLSVAGLAGGPTALLLAAIFWPSIPGIVVTILIAAFMAGAVGLLLSLPRDQDRQGPWNDDGAQV